MNPTPFLAGLLEPLVSLTLGSYGLPLSRAAVQSWVRLYTRPLPPDRRERRIQEVESHILEEESAGRQRGLREAEVALRLVVGTAPSIPGDIWEAVMWGAKRAWARGRWGQAESLGYAAVTPVDMIHRFHGFGDRHGEPTASCRIRIYGPTAASTGLPVVIMTELADNMGTSTTNMMEELAAEIVARYLPNRLGTSPPCIFIEHYPDNSAQLDSRSHINMWPFAEFFNLVTFSDYGRKQPLASRGRTEAQTFGSPNWQKIGRLEVERLIGEPLPEPICTCSH